LQGVVEQQTEDKDQSEGKNNPGAMKEIGQVADAPMSACDNICPIVLKV
jgi:hypothetical protein